MQKSGIEYGNLTARKRKNPFIAHAAELAGERAPIHAEKIGKCGTRIWQGIHTVIIGCERLQINFQSITQALLSQNAHLCMKASTCRANSCIRLAVTCIRQGQPIELSESSTPKSSSMIVQSEAVRKQTGLAMPPEQASSAPKICPS